MRTIISLRKQPIKPSTSGRVRAARLHLTRMSCSPVDSWMRTFSAARNAIDSVHRSSRASRRSESARVLSMTIECRRFRKSPGSGSGPSPGKRDGEVAPRRCFFQYPTCR